MTEHRRIAIVPARNEAGAIGGVLAELRLRPRSTWSSSTTARATARPRSPLPPVLPLVRLPFNLGIGGAVQTGFKYALEHGYDVVVRLDGDGQHDPAELPKLLGPLEAGEADIVVGLASRRAATARATTGRRSPGARASASSPASSRCSCARR